LPIYTYIYIYKSETKTLPLETHQNGTQSGKKVERVCAESERQRDRTTKRLENEMSRGRREGGTSIMFKVRVMLVLTGAEAKERDRWLVLLWLWFWNST